MALTFMLCVTAEVVKAQAVMPDHSVIVFSPDTCGTDSIIYFTYDGGYMREAVNYQVFVVADSLSGSTAATAYLQLIPKSTAAYVNIPDKTLVIDGVQSTTIWAGTMEGGNWRVKVIKSAGTMSIRLRVWAVLNTVK